MIIDDLCGYYNGREGPRNCKNYKKGKLENQDTDSGNSDVLAVLQ